MNERRMEYRRLMDVEAFVRCPKYEKHDLTDEQIIEIATKAVDVFIARQDQEIGRITRKGVVYILGATVTGFFLWLQSRGFIKIL